MNNSIIKFVTVILLLAALPISSAVAGELSVIINGKSYHINSSYDWNENNYGIGVEYEFSSESRWKKTVMANGFRDSNDDMSYMVGAGLHRRLFESDRLAGFYFDAGLTAFLMSREDVDNNKPFPGVLPSLRLGNRYAGINLTYLPKQAVEEMVDAEIADPTISGIVFLQFTVRLGRFSSK
jgi:hypothetical protein